MGNGRRTPNPSGGSGSCSTGVRYILHPTSYILHHEPVITFFGTAAWPFDYLKFPVLLLLLYGCGGSSRKIGALLDSRHAPRVAGVVCLSDRTFAHLKPRRKI